MRYLCLIVVAALIWQPGFATQSSNAEAQQDPQSKLSRWAQKLLGMYDRNSKPNIVVVSMPHASSTSLLTSLQESLAGYQNADLEVNNLGRDIINRYAKFFSKSAQIANNHVSAHEVDFRSLRKYSDKLVVVLSDPRQAVLEYINNLSNTATATNHNVKLYELDLGIQLPKDFYALGKSQQLDWGIDNILPYYIAWSSEWLDTIDREHNKENGIDILVINGQEMQQDNCSILSKIVNHYHIAVSELCEYKDNLSQDIADWQKAYSPEQLARISAMMSDQLRAKFGK